MHFLGCKFHKYYLSTKAWGEVITSISSTNTNRQCRQHCIQK